MLTPNRPKVPHRLLIRRPHGPGGGRNPYPNALRSHRGPNSHNCSRTHFLCPILPRQHKLRTNPQPNNSSRPRPSNSPSPNSYLMIYRQSRQPGPPPTPQPHSRTNDYYLTIQLILMNPCPNRSRNSNYCRVFPLYIFNNSTWPPSNTYYCPRTLPLSRTSFSSPPLNPPHSPNPQA